MKKLIFILVLLLSSCGARKTTTHEEYNHKLELDRLETKIETLISTSHSRSHDLTTINKVRYEYSVPDSTGRQHVTAKEETNTGVNLTSENDTSVESAKKDSLDVKIVEDVEGLKKIVDDKKQTTIVQDFKGLAWSVIVLLLLFLLYKIFKKFS